MHVYRRFALAALYLLGGSVVLVAGSIVLRQFIPDTYIGSQRGHLAALERQLVEFDSLTTNQRIVLIGSSHVMMGLSAKQIETATGVPTRNLAMNSARAVFQDYAAMVVEHIGPGDVAIIVNPNLMRLPRVQLPLRCVRDFGFECIRKQSGLRPHIVQHALVFFSDRPFGYEVDPRTPHGDWIFSEPPIMETVPPEFYGPFPKDGAEDLAELATDVRRRGACPIFVLVPLLPKSGEIALWQSEFAKLWREIDEAGLHDVTVENSPLWSDPALFNHSEHMSEVGREVWSEIVISKLHENVLPGSCGQIDVSAN